MGATKAVTDETFETEVLKSDKPVIVDYWAEWCGPCRMVAPVLEEIAAEYADKIDVVKLNIDENPAVSQRYGIMAIPTMNVFSGGEVRQADRGRQAEVSPAPRARRRRTHLTAPADDCAAALQAGRSTPWGADGVIEPSRRSRATSTSSRQVRMVRSSIRSRG